MNWETLKPKLRERVIKDAPKDFCVGGIIIGSHQPSPTAEPVKVSEPKRIRQDSKPLLNKLEAEYLQVLNERYRGRIEIMKQAMRFKLGNGIWYKPDFSAFDPNAIDCPLTCWEVKGPHAFRGGFENLKVAASLYKSIRWILVWKENGQWKQQVVLP